MDLQIAGLGIILYSPPAVAHIAEGADYLQAQFWQPHDVARHVMEGQLTCFCTGSPGDYRLQFHQGSPNEQAVHAAEYVIRLALQVHDGVVCIRDLYDLMGWLPACPPDQQIDLADGWYRLTIYSSPPQNGIIGDNQQIDLVFEKVAERPAIFWNGVPSLC